jgi:hypothetical protein
MECCLCGVGQGWIYIDRSYQYKTHTKPSQCIISITPPGTGAMKHEPGKCSCPPLVRTLRGEWTCSGHHSNHMMCYTCLIDPTYKKS